MLHATSMEAFSSPSPKSHEAMRRSPFGSSRDTNMRSSWSSQSSHHRLGMTDNNSNIESTSITTGDRTTTTITPMATRVFDFLTMHRKEILIGVLGIGVAILELVINQPASDKFMTPVSQACLSSSSSSVDSSLHPYIGALGGSFACIVTQLVYSLTQTVPTGFLTWSTTILGAIPAFFLMGTEGGRRGAKRILNIPALFMLLSQVVGVSATMSGIWLPLYLWGRSDNGSNKKDEVVIAPVRVGRLASNVGIVQIPVMLLSILAFQLDPTTNYPLWGIVVGILAGPAAALLGIPQSFVTPPDDLSEEKGKQKEQYTQLMNAEIKTLVGLAILSLLGWLAVVSTAFNTYGANISQLLNEIWIQAPPAIQFMTADAVVVYAGVVLAVAASSIPLAGICLTTTPLLGPGAAPLLALAWYRQEQLNKSLTVLEKIE